MTVAGAERPFSVQEQHGTLYAEAECYSVQLPLQFNLCIDYRRLTVVNMSVNEHEQAFKSKDVIEKF